MAMMAMILTATNPKTGSDKKGYRDGNHHSHHSHLSLDHVLTGWRARHEPHATDITGLAD